MVRERKERRERDRERGRRLEGARGRGGEGVGGEEERGRAGEGERERRRGGVGETPNNSVNLILDFKDHVTRTTRGLRVSEGGGVSRCIHRKDKGLDRERKEFIS